ncbi:MAG TPA: hypothetical protein VN516_10820 [Candidatus Baltobacteraceae bacterium]|nr:hypothetical protein [Candidatus Baltobacteraceae bacterium]
MKTIKTWAAFVLIAGTLVGAILQANGQTDSSAPIQMESVPLTTAIETLAGLTGTEYILNINLFTTPDGAITEPTVTFLWTNLTYSQALSRLLMEHGLTMVKDTATPVVIITRTNQTVNHVDASLLGSDSETNDLPPIRFQDVPLDIAFHALIQLTKAEVTLDPKLSGHVEANGKMYTPPAVSVRWHTVTAKQAIVTLCEVYDLAIVKDSTSGAITIKPRD